MSSFEPPPVPYLNPEFLKSQEARLVRILSEYLAPWSRLRKFKIRDTIVFFGSARSLAPEAANEELAAIEQEIERSEPSPDLERALDRCRQAVKLSRYYGDAMELARRVTEW